MTAGQALDGIDKGSLESWFEAAVPGTQIPLRFERIAGGRSNLTYEVRDAGGRGSRCAGRRSASDSAPLTTCRVSTG